MTKNIFNLRLYPKKNIIRKNIISTNNVIANNKLDNFKKISKELVLENNISQKDLYNIIREYLKENISEKEYILYNNCYGYMSFTNEFLNFIGKKDDFLYDRINTYEKIISFGKHLGNKYPLLLQLINTYLKDNINDQINSCIKYNKLSERKKTLQENYYKLLLYVNKNYFIDENENNFLIKSEYNILNFDNLLKSKGELNVNYLLNELFNRINMYENKIDNLKVNQYMLKIIESKISKINNYKEYKKYNFLEAIDEYGEDHYEIWNYQHILNIKGMQYLLFNRPINDKIIDIDTYKYLGLLGASGAYSALEFAEIPKGLSWSVSEYNGKENIYID